MDVIEKLQEQTERNTEAIAELAKSDAVQSVQIAHLAEVSKNQGKNQLAIIKWLGVAIIGLLFLTVLALVYGGLGERGFNGVTNTAQEMMKSAGTELK